MSVSSAFERLPRLVIVTPVRPITTCCRLAIQIACSPLWILELPLTSAPSHLSSPGDRTCLNEINSKSLALQLALKKLALKKLALKKLALKKLALKKLALKKQQARNTYCYNVFFCLEY
jgi:hypothetical protein